MCDLFRKKKIIWKLYLIKTGGWGERKLNRNKSHLIFVKKYKHESSSTWNLQILLYVEKFKCEFDRASSCVRRIDPYYIITSLHLIIILI